MNWKNVNVFQWQQLINLFTKEKNTDELDLAVKTIAILKGMTENEIDSMPLEKLRELMKEIEFVHTEIKPKPEKYIKVNGRRYKCVYDVRKIPAARYIESKHFSSDVNNNLHKIAASMVLPMRLTLYGWKIDDYDASKHEDYAQDMLEAPITSILGSVVFFYQVYRIWIKVSKDYLIWEMMKKGMTKNQAEMIHQTLCDTMDGFIKPHWLRNMKESALRKLMNSIQYNTLMT